MSDDGKKTNSANGDENVQEDETKKYKEFDMKTWLRRPRQQSTILKVMENVYGNCIRTVLQIRGGYIHLSPTRTKNCLCRGNIVVVVPAYQVSITFHASDLKTDKRLTFFQRIVDGGFQESAFQIKLVVHDAEVPGDLCTDGGKLIVLENTDLGSILFEFNVESNYQKNQIKQLAINMFEVE